MEPSTSYPVSPPDQRCVWMSAGILTYQLCDRDFDCATCPLDRAMRNMVKGSERNDARQIPMRVDPLRLGRYYTPEHCWLSIRTADTVRIGLEPNLAQRCSGLAGISLPSLGKEIPARSPIVWVRFSQGMIPVRVPLQVRPVAVNRRLAEDPTLLQRDPYDEGWLVEAAIDRGKLDACHLMTAWIAEKVYGHDEQQFFAAVRTAGGSVPKEAGVTAYDGGLPVTGIHEELGSGLYCTLVSQVYCKT